MYSGTSGLSTLPEIAVVTHFYARHGTKTTPVFLPADGESSRLLLPSLVSLLSGGTVQPENAYFVSSRWQVRSEKAKKR